MCLLQSLFRQQTYPTATHTIKNHQWNISHKLQKIHLDEKNAMSRTMTMASSLTWHIFDYRIRSWFQIWNIEQWLLHTLPDNTIQQLLCTLPDTQHYSRPYAHLQTLKIIQWFLCTVPDTWWQHSSHKIICGNSSFHLSRHCFTNINLIIGVFQIQVDLVVCSLSSIEFWRRSKWHATTACTGCLKTQLQCHTKSGMT